MVLAEAELWLSFPSLPSADASLPASDVCELMFFSEALICSTSAWSFLVHSWKDQVDRGMFLL